MHTSRGLHLLVSSTLWYYTLAVFYQGDVSSFNATRHEGVGGNDIVTKIYSTCVCYESTGEVILTGAPCVSTLFNYILQALAGAAQGATIAEASSGVGMVQESDPGIVNRRDGMNESIIYHAINNALVNTSSQVRATEVLTSDIHSRDGFAAKMNIYGHNTTLLIHTNGTHSTAKFGSAGSLQKREFLPTTHRYFTFNGVNGLKIQARNLNGTSTPSYVADLESFADQFVLNPANRTTLRSGDSWDYTVCGNSDGLRFYGRIIAELNDPDNNYEDTTPIECLPVAKVASPVYSM